MSVMAKLWYNKCMAELTRFLGIIIYLYYFDDAKHHTPHIHATYGEYDAVFDLDGNVLEGKLPSKQTRAVKHFCEDYQAEIREAWDRAVVGEPFRRI